MKTNPPILIGYTTIEEWLSVADVDKPVYASVATEVGEVARYGLRTDLAVVMVAQPDGDIVHYFRGVVTHLRFVNNEPFDTDHKHRVATIENAWKKVEEWLTNNGLTYRKGVIAVEKDVRLVDGDTSDLF